jgi:hypothetical protein
MFKQGRKILLVGGALAAVSFGGSALAAAGAAPVKTMPTKAATHQATPQKSAKVSTGAESTSGPDTDNVQSGDQTSPDNGNLASEAPGTETSDGSGTEAPGTETADGTEQAGSEVSNDDGPGGHADEPSNPNATHEASGQTQE